MRQPSWARHTYGPNPCQGRMSRACR
jgi:hypothetical protein